jgi:serine/threonine protein kinase
MLAFPCPHCGYRLKVAEELAGRKGRCASCRQSVRVPMATATPTARTPGSRPTPASDSEAPTLLPEEEEASPAPPGQETRVNSNSPGDPSVTEAPGGKRPGDELTDFLAPAQAPGELGRLGPYRVLRVLGTGGMGVVFQAEDPHLRRLIALKAMLPSLASNDSARQRFLREARAAAAIDHDHVVAIYQVGEDRGVPYLAMPFLQGESLDDQLTRARLLAPVEVMRIGREAAAGLAAAHKRGLIHRDVKPANLWLEAETGRVKILDFGLARAADDDNRLTQEGAILGTPAYMAPEQATGGAVDGRCDLFSLGCVLYRLCTGVPPFQGSDPLSIMLAAATEQPKAPSAINPKVPVALSALVMKLLAKKPEGRPPSAQAVVDAIRAIEADPTLVVPPRPRPSKPPPRRAAVKSAPAPARRRRRYWVPLAMAVLGAAALGVAAYLILHPLKSGTEPAPVIHLFNGKDLTHFYTYLGSPRWKAPHTGRNKDPDAVFTVHDDMIHFSGQHAGYVCTEEAYANYRLTVEYRWGGQTWPPREAKARSSGVLLHCVGPDAAYHSIWPESLRCQLIEGGSGTLLAVPGAHVPRFSAEAKERGTVAYYKPGSPLVPIDRGRLDCDGRDPQWKDVKDFRGEADVEKPLGEWNRLECVCTGDSVTVLLNGRVVNAATKLSHTRGRIALMSDGTEVFFRGIDLQPLAGFEKSMPPEEKRWQSLFNGGDLAGWVMPEGKVEGNWGADRGHIYTSGKDKNWLMTTKEYTDFEMRLEYLMTTKTNSGVALRTPPNLDPAREGLEIQIIDAAGHRNLRPEELTGSLFGIAPSVDAVTRPLGEWNHMLITVQGRRITVDLNDSRVLDADLDKYKNQAAAHPGLLRDKGRIGLQSWESRCEFRELYVRTLP